MWPGARALVNRAPLPLAFAARPPLGRQEPEAPGLRKILLLVVAAAVGVTAFFVFYHPPMRLMPPPLLFQDGGDGVFDVAPALAGSGIELFYATSRLPVGPRDNRVYTVAPDWRLHLGTADAAHRRGGDHARPGPRVDHPRRRLRPAVHPPRADGGGRHPRRRRAADAEAQAWLAEIDAALAASRARDILIYVHGANTTVERAAGQAAQLRHFAGREAVVVLFVWPTAENFLRYARDIRTALGSAPQLAELIRAARRAHRAPKHRRLHLQRRRHRRQRRARPARPRGPRDRRPPRRGLPRRAGRRLPRLRRRPRRLRPARAPGDRRRSTSATARCASPQAVNRASRAGRPDLRELTPETAERLLAAAADGEVEIVQVHPERMPELSATSHTFWYDHPWVSNDVLADPALPPPAAARGLDPGTAPSGARYWTFPPDYPARMPAVRDAVRAELAARQ